MIKYNKKDCFLAELNNLSIAAVSAQKNHDWIKQLITAVMLMTAIINIELMKLNYLITTLSNDIIIYSSDNSETVHQLSDML